MKVNNEIAQAIIDELMSSLACHDGAHITDAIVSLHEQDGTRDAQIAAEALKRVMPDITPNEYVRVASDVLRWYVEGDCLDCTPDMRDQLCSHG